MPIDGIREHTARVNTITTTDDVARWFADNMETSEVDAIEECDPEYHDHDPTFRVKIYYGLIGEELQAILDRFHVEELYTGCDVERFACRCCGDIQKGYAELYIAPKE